MLKPGGRLLMIVPDHVVSSVGFAETLRLALLRHSDLLGVFDLPTETFAQAGTRTKTSVVYFRRKTTDRTSKPRRIFMAKSEDMGFRVISRSGATVKKIVGSNDMEAITAAYKQFCESKFSTAGIVCLSQQPSIAAVRFESLINNRWTAGFYQTERLLALHRMEQCGQSEITPQKLSDVTNIDPDVTERVLADADNRRISVLHVREDGFIDLAAVDSYRPTTACRRCVAGDVLLSKINPRIVRICIVPETPWKLACSTEFAILRNSTKTTTSNSMKVQKSFCVRNRPEGTQYL